MQRRQSFGRRAAAQEESPRVVSRAAPKPASAVEDRPAAPAPAAPAPAHPAIDLSPEVDVDRELEQWNALRKAHKRSFREPWRSVSIAAALMFGLSTWLLPDSVANIAQLVTTGLAIASFAAGYRKRSA